MSYAHGQRKIQRPDDYGRHATRPDRAGRLGDEAGAHAAALIPEKMRTLIYKRTHTGDPDRNGWFGVHDCMGQVRGWDFDAVIGVGGIGAEPTSHGIDTRVTWVGLGAHKISAEGGRGPLITFDHFLLLDAAGPSFPRYAPLLARRIYEYNIRVLLRGLSADEEVEVERLLRLARNAAPSKQRPASARNGKHLCRPRRSASRY